jgi:COP9 signalosome complex subunit 8
MDFSQNYASLEFDLENQELSSSGRCSDRIYAQLLAVYLLTNDLQNARLLWKRIPDQTKNNSKDLKES